MDEKLKTFLTDVLSISDNVVNMCDNLGAMRSILAFSNLDRMKVEIKKDENFQKLSVIDADLVLWVSLYNFATNIIFGSKIDLKYTIWN
jgi:hypothetical protein